MSEDTQAGFAESDLADRLKAKLWRMDDPEGRDLCHETLQALGTLASWQRTADEACVELARAKGQLAASQARVTDRQSWCGECGRDMFVVMPGGTCVECGNPIVAFPDRDRDTESPPQSPEAIYTQADHDSWHRQMSDAAQRHGEQMVKQAAHWHERECAAYERGKAEGEAERDALRSYASRLAACLTKTADAMSANEYIVWQATRDALLQEASRYA